MRLTHKTGRQLQNFLFLKIKAETMTKFLSGNLATKADIELLHKEMAELGYKLTHRMGGMLAVGISVLTALVKL